MKRLTLCIVMVVVGLLAFGASNAHAQKSMAKKAPILLTLDDLKWEAIPNSTAMTAQIWGDANKGKHASMTKFPPGFTAPLHYHTFATRILVIKGAYTYNGKEYGPGSYLDIPGGDRHVSGGIANSETIFYMEQPGKFDLNPVNMSNEKK
jgi:quercetin dioxygenase-like cupin family protein